MRTPLLLLLLATAGAIPIGYTGEDLEDAGPHRLVRKRNFERLMQGTMQPKQYDSFDRMSKALGVLETDLLSLERRVADCAEFKEDDPATWPAAVPGAAGAAGGAAWPQGEWDILFVRHGESLGNIVSKDKDIGRYRREAAALFNRGVVHAPPLSPPARALAPLSAPLLLPLVALSQPLARRTRAPPAAAAAPRRRSCPA